MFDNNPINDDEPSSPLLGSKLRLDTPLETGIHSPPELSFDLLYEDHPLPTRKRPRRISGSPPAPKKLVKNRHTPSPLTPHATAPIAPHPPSPLTPHSASLLTTHPLSPLLHRKSPSPSKEFEAAASLTLFDSQPSLDFFGFSRAQESFSDVTSRKLFREDFI